MNTLYAYSLLTVFSACLLWACNGAAPVVHEQTTVKSVANVTGAIQAEKTERYQLDQPDLKMELDEAIAEISGITSADGDQVYGVQDEKGLIYHFSLLKKELIDTFRFKRDADYEDIVRLKDGTFFIQKSNGNLYRVKDAFTDHSVTDKFEGAIEKENDAEGLCYDARKNQLLIACKGEPELKKKHKMPNQKAVYAFDLEQNEFIETPQVIIDGQAIQAYMLAHPEHPAIDKLKDYFDDLNGNLLFQPSAIGIHPIEDLYYVLSSVGKMLLVLQKNGEVQDIFKLSKHIHTQPEGLCFLANGDLLISNEAKKGKPATIQLFKYKGMDSVK